MNRQGKSSHQQVASWRNGLGRRKRGLKGVPLMVPGSSPCRDGVRKVVYSGIDENELFFQKLTA